MLRSSLAHSLVFFLALAYAVSHGPLPAQAAKVKVWHHYNQGHHDKAQFKQAVVSSEGALRLSRQLRPLANLDATHVWDVIEDKQGNLFVATGDEGKIFKVAADGKVTIAYTTPDSQVLSLALAADGTIFAGTGPSGTIVCISPEGKARTFAKDLDSYVWSLAYDSTGKNLYAGTGPKGRIFHINSEGKSRVHFASKQDHILCLAQGPNNMLYAGTDKGGLVYRIDEKGKGFVLYHAHQAEVRSLLVTADGIYAGTSTPVRKRGSNSGSGSSSNNSTGSIGGSSSQSVGKKSTKGVEEKVSETPVSSSSSPSTSSAEESRGSGASSGSSPAAGENSLYRIALDGTVRELFREKTMVLSLLRENGRVLVGTGMQGQLFEIDEATKERSEIARLDHGQIHCLVRRRDGSIVLGTGDPGKLYVLEDKFAAKGTVISDVLDAKIISKWGSLTWKASAQTGSAVTIAVRTGNVADPDETWSDWSPEQANPANARIAAPTARFLQYRVTLSTDSPRLTPELRSLALRYMTTNQAPEVSSFDVPDLDSSDLENPKKLKLKWSGTDPNEDELTYNLYVRKDGWKNWVLLEEDLTKKDYEWDTSTFPSGIYQLKLVASDRRDNAPEDALTGERISAPIPVAHTPPTVAIKVAGIEGDQAILEATATDPLVRLTEASFAVNGKRWVNVFPTDGLFDSKTESFRFRTDSLRPGTYVLVLRVKDAAGNIGSGDVVFTVQPRVVAR